MDDSEFDGDGEDWLVTYADAITLIMAFFVLLYSMSTLDAEKYEEFRTSVSEHMGLSAEDLSLEGVLGSLARPDTPEKPDTTEAEQILAEKTSVVPKNVALAAELKSSFGAWLELVGTKISITGESVKLDLPGELLYSSGSVKMQEQARRLMTKMLRSFNVEAYANFMVTVEGHTDNRPVASEIFGSNWGLAALRASRVVDFFIAKGIEPSRIRAVSYAETQPKESNETEEGRALNRRVTILFEPREETTEPPVKSP